MTLSRRVRRMIPLRFQDLARTVLIAIQRDSLATARRKAQRYLQSRDSKPACMHIGCGEHVLDGWLNVDRRPVDRRVIAFDVANEMRFLDDESIDFIYHEAFFEHLDRRTARRLLEQCLRKLKPGGRMRIAVPDLDRHVQRYLAGETIPDGEFTDELRSLYGEQLLGTPGEALDFTFRAWEHRFIYSEQDLVRMLELNGYRNVRRYRYHESDVEVFRGMEKRPADRPPLIVEAEK